MAPEQARGEKVDARSDLFSLGCVLYQLCTGAMPFAGDTTMSLLMALALDHPKPVRELNPDMPAELSDLVMQLLEKDPAPAAGLGARGGPGAPGAGEATGDGSRTPTTGRERPAARPAGARTGPSRSAAPAPRCRRRRDGRGSLATGGGGLLAMPSPQPRCRSSSRRNKDGDKVAEVNVPPGGKVEVVDDGKKGDAAVAPNAAVDDAWLKQVAALPAEKQVEAVAAKLKERNPGFDGKVTPKIEDGVVTELQFLTDNVTDISPVRALPGLRVLAFAGSK